MPGRRFAPIALSLALLLTLALLAACMPAATPGATPAPTAAPPTAAATVPPPTATVPPTPAATQTPTPTPAPQAWWTDDVFYEIFVRSFQDSNGDGIGDFKGLTSKLDYLNDGDPNTTTDLGVTGIWLMPIHPSPSYHGYDVTDYKGINPEYGTMEDFKEFLDEAHKRGIKVIIDLVMNHTSSQHPWFVESVDPNSAKRDWYVWSDTATGNGWHDAGQKEKYYGAFGGHMPDLNYKNPEVSAAMFDVVKFWLEDVKVDGFRLDAIKYLVEQGGRTENTAATMDWLKEFHTYHKSLNPEAFTVGEVWAESMIAKFYTPDRVDAVFEFDMAEDMVTSAKLRDPANARKTQAKVDKLYQPEQFASFLTNHDQDRVRSELEDEGQATVAASLYLLYPGVPFIYYGEEIGMQGVKPDEDIRRPMQWTADGGFTTGEPWRPYFGDEATRNVSAQDADPASLLNHYRALIRLRGTYPALRSGDWRPVEVSQEAPSVYSFMRSLGDERILVVVNLDDQPVSDYGLSLEARPGAEPSARPVTAELLYGPDGAPQEIPVVPTDGFEGYKPVPTLPAYSTFVIRFAR